MKRRIEQYPFFGFGLLMFLVWSGTVPALTLHIEAKGSVVDIQANGASLSDVLTALSAKTGLVVKTHAPLTDLVTCNFTDLTLEQGVKQLLKNRSYAFISAKAKGRTSEPPQLWILGKDDAAFSPGYSASPVITQSTIDQEGVFSPDDRTNVHSKGWILGEVGDTEELSRQLSAIPSGTQTEEKGIVITKLAPESMFHEIGITQGDLVSRVNGHPIGTVEEFIGAFQSLSTETSTIMMIERRKPDGRLDPIYVHLE